MVAQSTRTTWINRITSRLNELQKQFLTDNNLEKKELVKMQSIEIAKELKLDKDIIKYAANKAQVAKLEESSRKRRDKINADTREKVTALTNENKVIKTKFCKVAKTRDAYVYPHSEPLFAVFDKSSIELVETSLREQYPQYAEYASTILKIPIRIDLITTPAALRDYLELFLPTIGIEF